MYKTIFLTENEKDIFQALKKQDIKTKVFEHRLMDLFNRVYNNYVGYYVFKQDDVVYKMIVLPKTIKPSDSAEKEFVNYLLHYYRINNIYKFDKEKKIPDSLLQLAFESNNSKYSSHNLLDKFQSYKYKSILQAIENFFKRHKNSQRIKVDYVSQSIKHKLNLGQNIKEMDKAKIHQIQNKDVVFSMLATVTHNALKLFVAQKYSGLEEKYRDELFKEVKKLQVVLLKKYKIERGYKLSIATLQGIKLTKLFSKTVETRQLLVDIKSLFGFEQMYKDDEIFVEYKQDLMTTSLFINPSNFYEWYVYDILKKYADCNGKKIQFAKSAREEGTITKYCINKENKNSNPDFILTDKNKNIKIVLDAKWKNIDKFRDIESSDYLKLKFDASLLQKKGYGVISYLIYPYIALKDRSFNIVVDDESLYKFYSLKIDMDFKNKDNSILFEYDFKVASQEMEIQQIEEKNKKSALDHTQNIQITRSELTKKLIEAETSEEKGQIGEVFDESLWQQAKALKDELEQEIILPEIQEILDQFKDIMQSDSIIFIKSTSTIYAHYREKDDIKFDYSMPGSGLWKLIELELNTSFVRYIRYKKGVISSNLSCEPILHIDEERNINWVKLNERDNKNSSKLKGLMFGQIKYLARNKHIRTLFKDTTRYNFDTLCSLIEKIVIIRNEHAHIKAMSKEKFEELYNILFLQNTDGLSNIHRLLIFKREIINSFRKRERV